ncbi:MAG: hypothetical protein FGM53_07350 [Rhodocyclaceae bacterium]|nr:hypothetical protein [Rhodocyclaceae bacterium]
MKLCCNCKTEKANEEFYANARTKDGLNTFCKECHKAHGREAKRLKRLDPVFRAAEAAKKKDYRSKPEVKAKNNLYMKRWHSDNFEFQKKYRAKYAEENKEYFTSYRIANKSRILARTRKRQASLMQRTPAWLDNVDYFEIECIYKYCGALRAVGLKYEVDHYYPLQGKEVSGLHVPTNLRVIREFDNRSKANRMEII